MAIEITIDIDVSKLEQKIINELLSDARNFLNRVKSRIDAKIKPIIVESLRSTKHYASILYDQLKREFGLANPQSDLDTIEASILHSVKSEIISPTNDYLGGLMVGAFRDDFSDALSSNGAKYTSVNKKGKSSLIEWLKWLLFEGDKIIITSHGLSQKYAVGSRTGANIMLPVKGGGGGTIKPWRVPPTFAGTKDSNWLVEAAKLAEKPIAELIEKEALVALNG